MGPTTTETAVETFEDEDDDNDGYNDTAETLCNSDPFDAMSLPTDDLDGDMICDTQDNDIDGDGLDNTVKPVIPITLTPAPLEQIRTMQIQTMTDIVMETPFRPARQASAHSRTMHFHRWSGLLGHRRDGQPDELWGTSTTVSLRTSMMITTIGPTLKRLSVETRTPRMRVPCGRR